MNANRLLALLVAGVPLVYTACGGDNLTLPSEGEPAHIAVTRGSPQSGRVGTQLAESLVVKVTDTQDRPVAGTTVNFAFDDATAGSATPSSASTDANGEARSSIALGTRVGELSGRAWVPVPEGTVPVTAPFTVTALSADANGIAAMSGDGQTGRVGTTLPQPLVVRVTDQFGNPIASVPVEWSVTGGGSVSQTSTVTDGNGQASVERTLGSSAGEQTTLAAAGGLAGSPVTFHHTATAGSAARINIVSGNNQSASAGSELPDALVVEVLDEQNNPIVNRAVSWIVGEGGGTVSPQSSNTNGEGRASTRLTLGAAPGNNTVNAVVSGVGTATFTATGTGTGAPSKLAITTQPTDVTAGATITPAPVIQVRDAAGHDVAVAGVDVTVAKSSGSGTLQGTLTVTTDANGRATFSDLRISGGTGSHRLIFAADGFSSVRSNSFDVNRANSPPIAEFAADCDRLVCSFQNRSRDNDQDPLTFVWDFGDGTTSTETDPSHTYAQAGTYTVRLTARDNHGATDETSAQVDPNNPPDATDDVYATPGAGQALTVEAPGVLQNDTDPDAGATLTASLTSNPTQGSVTLNSNGSFTYTPIAGAAGTDSFTYTATDNKNAVDDATVTITITP